LLPATTAAAARTTLGLGSVAVLNSITTGFITDANVTTAKIADANVTTAKIADANVTTAKIAAGAVTLDKLATLPTRNLAINGSLQVWQVGTSFAAIANATKTADCWSYNKVGSVVHTVAQDTADVPTAAQAGSVFPASMKATVTTTMAAPGAGDYCHLTYRMEGYRFSAIQQRTFVVNFWAKDAVTGIHTVAVANSGSDRSYAGEYTIASANTWQLCTVAITASPSAGTWNYTNGLGLEIRFCLVSGATFQTAPGSWTAGNFVASTGQVNGVGTNANVFAVAGVDAYAGTTTRDFDFRPFDEELLLCQRYYWKTFPYATAPAQNSGSTLGCLTYQVQVAGVNWFATHVRYPVLMRASPTMTSYNPSAANNKWRNTGDSLDSSTTVAFAANNETGFTATNQGVATDGVGEQVSVHVSADARL
jgi:hypothetical protein